MHALETVLSLADLSHLLVARTCSVCGDEVEHDEDGCEDHPLAAVATSVITSPPLTLAHADTIARALAESDRCTIGEQRTDWTHERENDRDGDAVGAGFAWGHLVVDVLVDGVVVGELSVGLYYGTHRHTAHPGVRTEIEYEGQRPHLRLKTGETLEASALAQALDLPTPSLEEAPEGRVVIVDGIAVLGRYADADTARLALADLQEPRYSGDRRWHTDAVVVDLDSARDVDRHGAVLASAGLASLEATDD